MSSPFSLAGLENAHCSLLFGFVEIFYAKRFDLEITSLPIQHKEVFELAVEADTALSQ